MSEFDGYLDRLASAEPVPGGGSAAALVAATGAALVAMVARVTHSAPRLTAVHDLARALAGESDGVRARLMRARERDEVAYAAVAGAMKLPKESDAHKQSRTAALQATLAEAAAAPLEIASLALEAGALSRRALDLGNANLASDLGCAAEFAHSAVLAAAYNVRVNHRYLKNADLVRQQTAQLEEIESAMQAALGDVRRGLATLT